MRKMLFSDNILVRQGLTELSRRLPPGWSINAPTEADATIQITAPDHRAGSITLKTRTRLDPKDVYPWVDGAREAGLRSPLMVLARYLSESTRARLREREVSYLDLSGNVRIMVAEPGLYIETQGASEDPDRQERPARSLRGPKAGRIVRALLDYKQPSGVRTLATMTKIDAGYVSRVLTFLDTEALITRVERGRIQSVDWPALLRRWALAAPLDTRGKVGTYLEPRGLKALTARLEKFDGRYVVTGGLAAAALAPIAPTRLGVVWIQDAVTAATRLSLRPAQAGANVLLIEPGDPSVFEGATQRDGVWYASQAQVAADLLTSPGRGPAEGEELIHWMQTNEEQWRQ